MKRNIKKKESAGWFIPPSKDLSCMGLKVHVRRGAELVEAFLGDKSGAIRLNYPTKTYDQTDMIVRNNNERKDLAF